MAATVRLVFFVNFVSRALSQAPEDGHSFCVDPIRNGVPNIFFNNITYPANERPLMDSRDYAALLEKGTIYVPPWQQVDNDNNNNDEVFTNVRCSVYLFLPTYTLQNADLFYTYMATNT